MYYNLKKEDIQIPYFSEYDVAVITVETVKLHLSQLKTKPGQVKDDVPVKVLKMFSAEIAGPLTDIINTSIRRGEWPDCWKLEYATPVPKEYPPKSIEELRNISSLKSCDKIAEKIIAKLIMEDMKPKLDPSQYANREGISIDHYLIKLIDRILTTLETNSKDEKV